MTLRPQTTRWFELLVIRDDLTAALEVLARSARVELQSHGATHVPHVTSETREMLEEFDQLDRRYGRHWPAPRSNVPDERYEPHVMLALALERLRGWAGEGQELVESLESLERQRADLLVLQSMLRDSTDPLPDLHDLTRAGPMLQTCLYLLPADKWPQALPAQVLTRRVTTPARNFLIAVGLPGDMETLERQLQFDKARPIQLPDDLPPKNPQAADAVQERLDETIERIAAKRTELDDLDVRYDVADALADVATVRWYVDNVPELASTEHFAWVTGWTSDDDEESLLALLAEADIKGLMRLSDPPPGFEAPLLLRNPAWMRPFEVFVGMLGVPAADEADPTRIVAIAGPLMFGFMFGDVGHGAVLLVAGLALSRRYPVLRLLVVGGAVSIVFGFLFGSVFALESIIEPVWVHPLEEPITVIVAPMVGGAVLLLVGMCLDAMQAYWRRHGRLWWGSGAGLVLCYVALLGSLVEPRLLLLALLGAIWFVVGHTIASAGKRVAAMGAALTSFLESLLQLVVNTISFVRVGAFALAHSGLSIAVVGVAEAPSSAIAAAVVLVLGNLLIIVLEGLVVGIQTTRLVLFEFFVRFLHAEGRPFKPLQPVESLPEERYRRAS